MIDDYHVQKIIEDYALKNKFTLVANTLGSLQYVKYNSKKLIITMKWSKGSDTIIFKLKDKTKKINISELKGNIL